MPFGSFWIKKKEEKKKVREETPIMISPSDQAQWDTGSVC